MGDASTSTSPGGTDTQHRIRVALVDDSDRTRDFVRLHLDLDGRFEIVGEAADGAQAIDLVERTKPDLVILDRQMPHMTGIEALPRIRAVSPSTAVVLYTSDADAGTYQAAIAAGALDVVLKDRYGDDFVDALADILLRFWSDAMEHPGVKVGPVPSASALAWIENSANVLSVIRTHPELLDGPVDDEVFDAFERFLRVWRDIAGTAEVFTWAARAKPDQVGALLRGFAAIDRVSDDDLAALGCRKADPAGREFFTALTTGIVDAVRRYNATGEMAALLGAQWGRRE